MEIKLALISMIASPSYLLERSYCLLPRLPSHALAKYDCILISVHVFSRRTTSPDIAVHSRASKLVLLKKSLKLDYKNCP